MIEDLFIVVCKDFHQAVGPFRKLDAAVKVCEQLNKASECSFLPVPYRQQPLEGDDEEYTPRGYM